MGNLFKAFLFKLRHDLTFKITLIIAVAVAFFMTFLYVILGNILEQKMVSGEMMLVSSLSPAQNFGLAIPINLVTFTVLEFTQGSIRNKIIAGHSKAKIYLSLALNGLMFSFSLITVYVLLCFGLGCIFGGFNPIGATLILKMTTANYIPRMLISAIFCYLSITLFAIFFSTLFRSIGPSIPVIILVIVFAYIISTLIAQIPTNDTVIWTVRIFDPFYALSSNEMTPVQVGSESVLAATVTDESFFSSIISNVVYSSIFFILGIVIFKNRDIK